MSRFTVSTCARIDDITLVGIKQLPLRARRGDRKRCAAHRYLHARYIYIDRLLSGFTPYTLLYLSAGSRWLLHGEIEEPGANSYTFYLS